jgi:predicted MFS family arabinose efflux permease
MPLWSLHLSLNAVDAGRCFLALAVGAVAAMAAGKLLGLARSGRLRGAFTWECLLISMVLIGLSFIYQPAWLALPLIGLGAAAGAMITTTSAVLRSALTDQRAADVLNLAGVSFGCGAVLACSLIWLLADAWMLETLLRAAALPLIAAAYLAARGPRIVLDQRPAAASRGLWRVAVNPTGVLLAISLLLQTTGYGLAGGWLAWYLSRRFGLPASSALAVLATFWTALTCGRVAATRLPSNRRFASLAATGAVILLGSVFLLNTTEFSGAVAGAILAGLGLGALHPLTLSALPRRYSFDHPSVISTLFVASFVAGMLGCAAIGPLSSRWGIEIAVWAAALAGLAAIAVLMLILAESRLAEAPGAVG